MAKRHPWVPLQKIKGYEHWKSHKVPWANNLKLTLVVMELMMERKKDLKRF